ncbi:glycoside hydrolase family 79 protein [Pluteus cervinus]|uniref:Glycoside hydrolase family 79 protein n=1 Tax=Pluteus cervinus TaxID=181527 RepID=A0ACD3B4N8_9AGAR|nr:glycoside hydrolase family 79 protein [Pluteus cervinus]
MLQRLASSAALLGCLPAVSSLSSLRLGGPPTLPGTASHFLHPALGSFSIETAFFETFLGNSSSPNNLSRSLFENLKARTGVPPEVRIGGITADSTYWDPNLDVSSFNFVDKDGVLHNTTIGPGFWDSVKLLPEGTKITINLDLNDLNYTGALEVATSALRGLPRDQLDLFEIGNEPDHYLSFTPRNYSEIWATWAQNISSTLNLQTPRFQIGATVDDPLWPYNTPSANRQLDCVNVFASGVDLGNTVRSCSEHTYQYSVCDPPRIAVATLPNLVNHTRLAMYLDLWQPRINAVRDRLGPHSFVIGEYNSVSCSGRDGVSNTFGQSLWLVDTTLYAASLNVSRMFIHQGGPLALQSSSQLNHGGLSFYDLWYPVQNLNGPIKVFPSYSAYLFLAEALGTSKTLRIANIYPGRQANGSTITPALGDESAGGLVAYGFWDDSATTGARFPTKLALLNLQLYNQTQTGIRPSTTIDISAFKQDPNSEVKIRRLQAPGADVREGDVTRWAGQVFSSGQAVGRLAEERITGGSIVVPDSEAALVFLT